MGARSDLQDELRAQILEMQERHRIELAPLYVALARCRLGSMLDSASEPTASAVFVDPLKHESR